LQSRADKCGNLLLAAACCYHLQPIATNCIKSQHSAASCRPSYQLQLATATCYCNCSHRGAFTPAGSYSTTAPNRQERTWHTFSRSRSTAGGASGGALRSLRVTRPEPLMLPMTWTHHGATHVHPQLHSHILTPSFTAAYSQPSFTATCSTPSFSATCSTPRFRESAA
jgi:hypothetical protein